MTTTATAGATATAGRRVTPTGRLILPADAPRSQWLAARTKGVGSSDVPAILGVNDYRTPLHVYYDKRGGLPDDAGEPAYWGTVLEEPVARHWAMRNRGVIRRVGLVAHEREPWMLTTLDRRVTECRIADEDGVPCGLEVKTRSAFKSAQWHREVPDDVAAQVLWQIAVNGYRHMHYAVLIGGNDYREGIIRADEHAQTIADIVAGCRRFWTEHVLAEVPPPHSGNPERLVEMYRRQHPDRSGVVHLDHDPDALAAVQDYEAARLAESAAKRRKKAAHAEMLRLLGPHQNAVLGDEYAFGMEPTSGRADVDLEHLAAHFPDAYRACVTQNPGERIEIGKTFKLKKES